MPGAAVAKFIAVSFLLVVGALSLLAGFGAELPFVKFKEFEAYGVPAGAILLASGIALAKFWKVATTRTTETFETTSGADDESPTTVFKKTETTTTFGAPPHGQRDIDL